MAFSKIIMWLLGVYLLYYALNFIYDVFIKKDNKKYEEEEELAFVGDIEPEEVQAVQVVEEVISPTPEKKKLIEPETREVKKIIEPTPIVQEPIIMEVETQAIPYSVLMGDSKQIFAGIF